VEKGFLADLLELKLSGRSSKYATGIKANTYGTGLVWAPISEVKLRASYNRAIRAPNLIELFTPQGNALYDNDEDPCAGATPTATLVQCARTGVTAAQYGTIQDSPAGQYNFLAGGNSKLKPEVSTSALAGIVLTPFRELSVTIDYFDIKIKEAISNIGPATTLAKCIAGGEARFCSLITRDRLGTLWLLPQASIDGRNLNIGSSSTSGFDLAASYTQKLGDLGSTQISYASTVLRTLITEELPGEGTFDCAGLYGVTKCGSPNPKYRHKLRATWSTPYDFEAAITWRHFSAVTLEITSDNPLLKGTTNGIAADKERQLAAQNYLDLAASYTPIKGLTLSLGMNNVFDKDPPITARLAVGQGNGNTYPQVYDALGRKVFFTGSYKF
jgi:iron complex outermembrane recepter protein